MSKDFDKWNTIKKKVDNLVQKEQYFKERDIWWCYCGVNIGHEQNGKGDESLRPVLIFKKFNINTCWVIPLSLKVKNGSFYFPLLSESNIISIATIPQLKMVDSKRLIKRVDLISVREFSYIKEKVIAFIR
jgi:mRNA interferase MazF